MPQLGASSHRARLESLGIPHSGTLTQCRTYRTRRPPWPMLRFPTSPPSKVSKTSGMPPGPSRERTCSTAPRRPQVGRAGHLLRRHSPADGLGKPAHRPRLQLHAHRREGALRAHARQDGVLPDGLGRQRPAHRAPRSELLRRPLRPEPPLRRGLHAPVRGRRQQEQQGRGSGADQPPQLHRAVRAPHRRGREALRGPVAQARAQRRLDPDLPHHLGRHDPHEPARVPRESRARRGLPGPRSDAVGHRLPLGDRPGRARGSRPAGRVPPRRLPQERRLGRHPHRDDPTGAARGVRRARRPPRRRPLQAALRLDGAHADLRRRGSRPRPSPRSARQGLWHRHDLHVRRCDRHHLVARAGPAEPHHPRQGRTHRRRGAGGDRDGCRQGGVRGARGPDRLQRQEARGRAAQGVGRAHR